MFLGVISTHWEGLGCNVKTKHDEGKAQHGKS